MLLLKLSDLTGAEVLLMKTNAYLSDKRNEIVSTFDNQLKTDVEFEKQEQEMKEKHDTTKLIYKHDLEHSFKDKFSNNSLIFEDNDNGIYIEAKFNYYFVSGLLE